ncbi:ABC transporter ATP-binding protein [Cerasicoccus arenae]|uniref:ABC transporter n=1 Tax=Cerasicoccus arenae TaxID=424488 RepID=A0A8J3GDE5_9BACT|nr:ABC transporter ATP-binding protein [Cerasicoccus arenae]MBK1857462.1 ABC transporter ATP-binding protein [Cerasicoccus arenae]GHB95164.1 ABC transporter [Cerasicoccus arenae]
MSTDTHDRLHKDRIIIERYAGQPAQIPPALIDRVKALNNGRGPLLYAMADLDTVGKLTQGWLVLGHDEVFFFATADDNNPDRLDRSEIQQVMELPGLSSSALLMLRHNSRLPLMQVNYSRRQKQAMENIRFVLDQQVKGHAVSPENADRAYAESVSAKIKDAQSSVMSSQFQIIMRLIGYFRPYRKDVTVGFACALVVTMLNLIPPFITGYVIDKILKPLELGELSSTATTEITLSIVGGLALLYLTRELCVWVRLKRLAYLGENVAHDLRRDLYSHLQKLSLTFFSKKQTGSIISRVSSDTDRLWDFIAFGVVEATLAIVMLIGLGTVLISMDWQLGLILVIPVPAYLYAYYLHGKHINKYFMKAWRKWSDVTAVLSDTIPGMRVVKAFSQESREVNRFGKRNDKALESFREVHGVWTKFWPMLMGTVHFVTLIVWAFALPRVFGDWGKPLSVGTFVAFLMYMGMFFHPLEVIGQITRMLNRAVSSAHRVFEIMDTEPDPTLSNERCQVTEVSGKIVLENVNFSYDGVHETLRNISFTIKPGEMIGLVGPSGAGKSTITNLIAGFYQATGGKVLIDGRDLAEVDVSSYRQHLGMVLQEPFLFHGSLLENIRYGQRDAGYEDVIEAARAANAHDFICKLPLGYDTVVGERGHTLSGGERQRISIARAILHNPKILILDEATSNVDTETERKIQEALNKLVQGRTVIAIAHRLSTLKQADRLLVMKDGQLVEQGSHQDLLELPDGVYRKLHNMQTELHEQFAI